MKIQKTHNGAANAKSRSDEYLHTLREQMPALDRLFVGLAKGKMPGMLDLLEAISEMVAFQTDCDPYIEDQEIDEIFESQNKCRFCT